MSTVCCLCHWDLADRSMLLNFKMGSGNLLQYVSTRSQFDNVKSKRDKVAVFATGDYHGEGERGRIW